jgi:response regulator RpfG family c-di-GMP phosphodiesterase
MVNKVRRITRFAGAALRVQGFQRGVCPMRVLLIEDEPTTAKAIEMMLATEGFNVYTTDLGEEGLDLGKL